MNVRPTGICGKCGKPFDDDHLLPAVDAVYQIPLCTPPKPKKWTKA